MGALLRFALAVDPDAKVLPQVQAIPLKRAVVCGELDCSLVYPDTYNRCPGCGNSESIRLLQLTSPFLKSVERRRRGEERTNP